MRRGKPPAPPHVVYRRNCSRWAKKKRKLSAVAKDVRIAELPANGDRGDSDSSDDDEPLLKKPKKT